MKSILNVIVLFTCYILFTYMTCRRDMYPSSVNPGSHSIATGVKYNDKNNNTLFVKAVDKTVTGNGVFLEGGSISLTSDFEGGDYFSGSAPTGAYNVTVPSMVVDRTPVCNIHWTEMIDWLKKFGPKDFYKKLKPDEKVWFKEFSYNDPIVKQYFNHPTFWFHPVVGVSWVQAVFYCWWRTLRTNMNILDKMKGYDLFKDFGHYPLSEIAGCELSEISNYEISKFAELKLKNVAPKDKSQDVEEEEEDNEFEEEEEEEEETGEDEELDTDNKPNLEEIRKQGLLLVSAFRLPTFAEFAYYINGSVKMKVKGGAVSKGAMPKQSDLTYKVNEEVDYYNGSKKKLGQSFTDGVIVKNQLPKPWNTVRSRHEDGSITANFKQGHGEYGDSGITSYVFKYPPNAHGIFCFVGVSEFLQGVFREVSTGSISDLNPLRRNDKRDESRYYKDFNPLITARTRTYIGPNYEDTLSVSMYLRRPIKEAQGTSYIGFRCVQTVINIENTPVH